MSLNIEERVSRLERNTKIPSKLWSATKNLGMVAFVVTAAGAGVLYVSTKAQLERATQKVGDLNAQLGVAEEHLAQLNARVTKADEVARRLERLDAADLKRTLDQIDRPEFRDVVKVGAVAARLDHLDAGLAALQDAKFGEAVARNAAQIGVLRHLFMLDRTARPPAKETVLTTEALRDVRMQDIEWEGEQHRWLAEELDRKIGESDVYKATQGDVADAQRKLREATRKEEAEWKATLPASKPAPR